MGITFNLKDAVYAEHKSRLCYINYMYTRQASFLPQDHKHYVRTKYEQYLFLDEQSQADFNKAQRVFHAWLHLKNRWIQKHVKKYNCTEDLYGTPLKDLPKSKVIQLNHYNCIYTFNINDLFNIIRSSIHFQTYMAPFPKMPKNPYINKEFSHYHMLTICLHCWQHKIKIPYYLQLFHKSDFNCEHFLFRNRVYLSETAVKDFMPPGSCPSPDIKYDIMAMLQKFLNPFMTLSIHYEFPLCRLYAVFRPYLCLYYKMRLLNCAQLRRQLEHGLKSFALFNPNFGKKFISNNGLTRFDDRCLDYIDFNKNDELSDSVFDMMKACRFNILAPYCVSLEPINGVRYIEMGGTIYYDSMLVPPLIRIPNDTQVRIIDDDSDESSESDDSEDEDLSG
jgi:hypothetical protein